MEDKLSKIKILVQEWVDKQSHDKCWYYPDIFEAICKELDIEITNKNLPSAEEFKLGCEKYRTDIYSDQS